MTNVRLYLAEGFANDRVVISIDGRKVFDEDGVTTKKLYGLALELAPVAVAGGAVQIDIELPQKGVRASIRADLSKGDQIPISIEDGRVTHFVGKQVGFG